MTNDLRNQLIRHEGLRLQPYRCPAGKLTIGVGRNLEDKGISRDEALYLLDNDIRECSRDLSSIFPDFHGLEIARKHALIDLRFNLGPSGFRSFKRMIEAAKVDDWDRAAEELKDSLWWNQVQDERKFTLYRQIQRGI